MRIRRILSATFILMIFVSSPGSFADSDLQKMPVDQSGHQTQLSEDSEDTLPEFRQTFKVNLSQGARTRPQSFQFELTSLVYRVGIKQYLLYRQKRSSSTNEKLFIDFRTLLI